MEGARTLGARTRVIVYVYGMARPKNEVPHTVLAVRVPVPLRDRLRAAVPSGMSVGKFLAQTLERGLAPKVEQQPEPKTTAKTAGEATVFLMTKVPESVAVRIHEAMRKADARSLGDFLAQLSERALSEVERVGSRTTAKTTGRTALALNARRGDIFFVDHNDPNVIIELPGKKHVLYDQRDEQPADPVMVDTLKRRGQEVPAQGFKQSKLREGKQVVTLVNGRRRWKAIQVAWAELLAAGVEEKYLPPFRLIVKSYVSDMDAFEAAVIENCHRREQEDDLSKARKLQTYLDRMGHSDKARERARVIFNLKDKAEIDVLLTRSKAG